MIFYTDRYGILLGKRDFKALASLSIEGQIAVF